jgi:hypothetical protein
MRDYLVELIHAVSPGSRGVATVIPPSIREGDLLATAAKQKFDVAILVLNNVFYAPYYPARRPATLTSDGIFLIRRMIRSFKMPIIALYGMPDDASHVKVLMQTGVAAAMKLPFDTGEMKRALKRCLASID